MKSKITAVTVDKRQKNRRFRDILANSGLVMESGEVRDIPNLYVMSYGGELINVNDLAKDPEKQTELYSVKAQADHGEVDDAGYSIPTVEKQFGSCRVWTEDDGLHARVYFANDDVLADHLFAISDDASYSIGTEWAEPGYEWNGKVYEDTIGILREISMVITGNDPRARTTDHKSETTGSEGAVKADGNKENKENTMGKTTKDALTPDEREALVREIVDKIDDFTTSAPESETEPTARDNAEAEGEAKTENKPEEKRQATGDKKDSKTLSMPFVVINNKTNDKVKNEISADTNKKSGKWLATDAGKTAFRKTFDACGQKITPAFESMLLNAAKKDGITGLAAPAPLEQIFVTTMEKRDGIYNHFRTLNIPSYRVNVVTAGAGELGRAHGFKKGDTKIDQELTVSNRDLWTKMVYKKLTFDSGELYENPELYDIRREEIVEALFVEMERAAVIGDGRTAPTGNNPDYRMFDGVRGFYSMLGDTTTTTAFATAITGAAGENFYETRIDAYADLKAEGRRIMVAKGSSLSAVRKLKNADGSYLVAPGARLEDVLDVDVIYEPSWMEGATVDAVIFVEGSYTVIGEVNQIREKTTFDTNTNGDVLLVETPRGGSLTKEKSAVAITLTPAAKPETQSANK